MDAVSAQLVQSLTKSVQELAQARADAADKGAHLKYAELTGRMETMRTVIAFFQQSAQAAAPPLEPTPKKEPVAEKKEEPAS